MSERVIGCAYTVGNELGPGFLERVYEKALCVEMIRNGLEVERQKQLNVTYKGEVVGKYFADILVENCLLLEVKAVARLSPEHKAQVINYLKATDLTVSLLINFGTPRTEIKRIVWRHDDSKVI
ncbi:MAG: GxxExxY protein [Candidatus Thiodiazotropha sp. (ex Lucina aurantia)]|nr:GxxExxY protein [Candidatus Thiodiazotropha sp. (ex Lucina pensylvanica)]MBT3021926.1 GxxExxY protein [Candidatus Thiodiazotropha taylori]MBV2097952.1 GxxExxY protein [Candidatus Thiodiazotropha sp. (ex Codakia orbicularis)]MBV2102315.1 GxxExxY protein [Candidatus Thiodiazotropha sp. (ex Lucina aurantia)]MBV2116462.1 GxxExxY protein [Candidatus Thiodiazotropha sp. (ex Lucina aurantia)]